jgi:hypothetical protein
MNGIQEQLLLWVCQEKNKVGHGQRTDVPKLLTDRDFEMKI